MYPYRKVLLNIYTYIKIMIQCFKEHLVCVSESKTLQLFTFLSKILTLIISMLKKIKNTMVCHETLDKSFMTDIDIDYGLCWLITQSACNYIISIGQN